MTASATPENYTTLTDATEVQTAEGKLYLFVAIDRTSKFAFVQRVESANRGIEPLRVCRRPFCLSHAAMSGCSIMAW